MVGIIGRLTVVKGHRYFLQGAAQVLQTIPHCKFLVIGDGPLRSDLELLANDLGISDSVRFLGYRDDIPELLAVVDISVLTSIREGTSMVLLESMAAGKPIVATDVGGTPEVVIDGEVGILVPPKDAAALAKALITLLSDPCLASRMEMSGRQRVQAKFSLRKSVDRLEALYDELVAARKGMNKTKK